MKRHSLSTRLWHWLNLVCVVVLFMSGLTISNAHRRLHWGDWGFAAEQAWLIVPRFPDWMTIPGCYSLAVARDWHILMAWPFALGLLLMCVLIVEFADMSCISGLPLPPISIIALPHTLAEYGAKLEHAV